MTVEVYRYEFVDFVPVEEIESSLLLAVWSCEAIHGEAQVRLDAAHFLEPSQRACVIDANTPVGKDINRLFVSFLRREFGADAFQVRRVTQPVEARNAAA